MVFGGFIMANILVVDDEAIICEFMATLLGNEGHTVFGTQNGENALAILREKPVDLVIADHRMQPMDGMELLRQVHQFMPHVPVLILSGYTAVNRVIEALKNGAFDFLSKPVNMNVLEDAVERALTFKKLNAGQIVNEDGDIPTTYSLGLLIAESPAMKGVCQKIQQVASTNTPVLIHGPEGTGRSVVADSIHRTGKRVEEPFLTLDCASADQESLRHSLTHLDGELFSAGKGTLYLRNIEMLPAELQGVLFRIIEYQRTVPEGECVGEKDVECRILASTSASLINLVGQNRFQPELYTRLARAVIHIPPLAERPEDVLPLFSHLLSSLGGDPAQLYKLDEETRLILLHYTWPGNGQEMGSLIFRILPQLADSMLRREHLPEEMVQSVLQNHDLDPVRRKQAAEALRGTVAKSYLRKARDEYRKMLEGKDHLEPTGDVQP